MAGITNQLVDYAAEAASLYDLREYDVVVSSGEQVTAGLLAIVLQDLGDQGHLQLHFLSGHAPVAETDPRPHLLEHATEGAARIHGRAVCGPEDVPHRMEVSGVAGLEESLH